MKGLLLDGERGPFAWSKARFCNAVVNQMENEKTMMKIILSDEIKAVCPDFVCGCVEAQVENTPYSEALWGEIKEREARFKASLTTETLKDIGSIAATRRVYRACGKDPSRYRPSGEALVRRILQGKGLYQVNTLVDIINLASMVSGYSIGGFDASKFRGDTLTLGVGRKDEPYEGIGRGLLNIEGLPVYRDAEGGVGTPTSDHERTKIDLSTRHLLVLVNGYDGDGAQVQATADYIRELLGKYGGCDGTVSVFLRHAREE